jgi:hypothetical protein
MVIQFNAPKSTQPKGMFDSGVIGDNGLVLIDGCIPASLLPAIRHLLGKAGVTLGEMIPE